MLPGGSRAVHQHPIHQLGHIVLEHGNICGSRTAWLRQGIGEELAAHLGAAFPADRLHQSGVGDVFDEKRVDVFTLDLVDQPGELTCGGLIPTGARNSTPYAAPK